MATYTTAYDRDVDILGNACISEDPERLQLNKLSPEIHAQIVAAGVHGFRPACIYWPDGKYALICLAHDASMPTPEMIIAAYLHCEQCSMKFPEGSQSWLS